MVEKSNMGIQSIPIVTRAKEIESQLYCTWDFLEVIEELYPDEFDEAYEEYKRRF